MTKVRLKLPALGSVPSLYSPLRRMECLSLLKATGTVCMGGTSVADTDPDPHVFGPPGSGSGSTSQRYGSGSCSGSGSFYHHAKIVRKTLIPTSL